MQTFVGPFLVTFMIALFILVMQTLWVYIDDIAGKGVGLLILIELLAYRSFSLVPLALPIAVLISSVMVMGGMGEKYELSSIKSAGVSLFRTMRPMLFMGVLAALFSYFCAVYLIPLGNLRFGARMYDISQKKPTLRLQEGVFNDDFGGYSIHIGSKGRDGRSIADVLIYDHKEANRGKLGVIIAESGEMFATPDGNYFVMNLKNGHQYIEPEGGANRNYPFITSSFDEWTKVFDLSEFALQETNVELFKHNRSMLTIEELEEQIDTLSLRIHRQEVEAYNVLPGYLHFLVYDSTYIDPIDLVATMPDHIDSMYTRRDTSSRDSLLQKDSTKQVPKLPKQVTVTKTPKRIPSAPLKVAKETNRPKDNKYNRAQKLLKQQIDQPLADYTTFLALFDTPNHRQVLNRAKNSVNTIRRQGESSSRRLDHIREDRVKHIYDLHTKYSMAVACFIFIFIGGPMGAIVRKGGFGYPLLVAIIFFTIFVVLTIFCRKIAESFVVPAATAAWIPCFVLLPLGLLLTYQAMNDSKMTISITLPSWLRFRKQTTEEA